MRTAAGEVAWIPERALRRGDSRRRRRTRRSRASRRTSRTSTRRPSFTKQKPLLTAPVGATMVFSDFLEGKEGGATGAGDAYSWVQVRLPDGRIGYVAARDVSLFPFEEIFLFLFSSSQIPVRLDRVREALPRRAVHVGRDDASRVRLLGARAEDLPRARRAPEEKQLRAGVSGPAARPRRVREAPAGRSPVLRHGGQDRPRGDVARRRHGPAVHAPRRARRAGHAVRQPVPEASLPVRPEIEERREDFFERGRGDGRGSRRRRCATLQRTLDAIADASGGPFRHLLQGSHQRSFTFEESLSLDARRLHDEDARDARGAAPRRRGHARRSRTRCR